MYFLPKALQKSITLTGLPDLRCLSCCSLRRGSMRRKHSSSSSQGAGTCLGTNNIQIFHLHYRSNNINWEPRKELLVRTTMIQDMATVMDSRGSSDVVSLLSYSELNRKRGSTEIRKSEHARVLYQTSYREKSGLQINFHSKQIVSGSWIRVPSSKCFILKKRKASC